MNFVYAFLFIGYYFIELANGQKNDRVLLKEVQVLTLRSDGLTTGRRSSRISQLNCVGNRKVCQKYAPSVVQCYNKGFDGVDTQWECKSELDKSVKFGALKVSCEGYDYPEDPYILAGSCGTASGDSNPTFTVILIVVIIGIAIYVVSGAAASNQNGNATTAQAPPAGFKPEYMSSESTFRHDDEPKSQGSSGWTNFAAGAAAGGLAAHLLTKRNQKPMRDSDWPSSTSRSTFDDRSDDSKEMSSGYASTSRR